jgi:hypothetical protein
MEIAIWILGVSLYVCMMFITAHVEAIRAAQVTKTESNAGFASVIAFIWPVTLVFVVMVLIYQQGRAKGSA